MSPPYTFNFVVLWFEVGENQYVHLLHKPAPDTDFCARVLHVPDAAFAEHCRAHGVAIDETVGIPNADRFFIRDPDGNRIELIQWLKAYDPAALKSRLRLCERTQSRKRQHGISVIKLRPQEQPLRPHVAGGAADLPDGELFELVASRHAVVADGAEQTSSRGLQI